MVVLVQNLGDSAVSGEPIHLINRDMSSPIRAI